MQPNSLAAQEIIDLLIASMSPETKRRAIIDLAKYNSVNLDHEKYDALALKQNVVINTVDDFFSYIVNFSKDEGVAINNNYEIVISISHVIRVLHQRGIIIKDRSNLTRNLRIHKRYIKRQTTRIFGHTLINAYHFTPL